MIYGWPGYTHTSAAIAALFFGAFVFPMVKGTRLHKELGYLYATALFATNVIALGLCHLTGHFGLFHLAAIASFVTLLSALVPVITPRPKTHGSTFTTSSLRGLTSDYLRCGL